MHLYILYDLQCFQVNSFIILGVLAIFNHGRLATFHGGLLYSRIIAPPPPVVSRRLLFVKETCMYAKNCLILNSRVEMY